MTKCRYCPAEIMFAVNDKSGKRMPLDPVPSPNGTIMLEFPVGQKEPIATVVKEPEKATCALYVSHFATCQGVQKARKRR